MSDNPTEFPRLVMPLKTWTVYTLWYCYDNTHWQVWSRYGALYLAEKGREELKLYKRPYDSSQPQPSKPYLWTVIFGPGEEPPTDSSLFLEHESFQELDLSVEVEEFGANVEDS